MMMLICMMIIIITYLRMMLILILIMVLMITMTITLMITKEDHFLKESDLRLSKHYQFTAHLRDLLLLSESLYPLSLLFESLYSLSLSFSSQQWHKQPVPGQTGHSWRYCVASKLQKYLGRNIFIQPTKYPHKCERQSLWKKTLSRLKAMIVRNIGERYQLTSKFVKKQHNFPNLTKKRQKQEPGSVSCSPLQKIPPCIDLEPGEFPAFWQLWPALNILNMEKNIGPGRIHQYRNCLTIDMGSASVLHLLPQFYESSTNNGCICFSEISQNKSNSVLPKQKTILKIVRSNNTRLCAGK